MATLLSLTWLLMPATPWDTSTRKEQGFCRVFSSVQVPAFWRCRT